MQHCRQLLVEYPRINSRAVCGHLYRVDTDCQRSGEEALRCGQVTAGREHDVNDLTTLIDRPVQVSPATGYAHVGLIDEPAVTRKPTARTRSLDELGREALHPPVHGHVIDADAAFGEQFLNVPVGQAVPQVPAHRKGDHLTREAEPGKR